MFLNQPNPNKYFFPVLLCFVSLLTACQDGQQQNTGVDSTAMTDSTNIETTALPAFEKLDEINLTSMKKTSSRYIGGEGDCENYVGRYEGDGIALFLDTLSCGSYYTKYTYYLLDAADTIQMVQVKHIAPFANEDGSQFFYALSEKVIDFQGTQVSMKARNDTLPQSSPETEVQYDEDYQSAPWLSINGRGKGDFVLGKKIDYDGDWYQSAKKVIKDSLSKMTILPRQIPMQFSEDTGMGIRGEYRSMGTEAIEEVASVKAYELRTNFDHFTRIKKPLVTATEPSTDELSLAYWQKRYGELQK